MFGGAVTNRLAFAIKVLGGAFKKKSARQCVSRSRHQQACHQCAWLSDLKKNTRVANNQQACHQCVWRSCHQQASPARLRACPHTHLYQRGKNASARLAQSASACDSNLSCGGSSPTVGIPVGTYKGGTGHAPGCQPYLSSALMAGLDHRRCALQKQSPGDGTPLSSD